MSGAVKSNVFGSSGTVAAAAGGLSWQYVVTASTVTVESNKGYFINTTSNACTVTLPASPDVGDQVILLDYARTWDTNAITIDSNGNNFQGQADTYTVDYDTEGQGINIVYSGSTNGWIPNSDIANALTPVAPTLQRGIFAFGTTGSAVGLSNLINTSGVVAADVAAVDTANRSGGSSNYGGDKAIFAFGRIATPPLNVSRLVSNSGVIGNDVTGVGTARYGVRGVAYGSSGQAAFAFGNVDPTFYSLKNLVSSSGVVASDTTGVGTARWLCGATEYGDGLGIFAYGVTSEGKVSMSNKINTSGVIAADVTGVGTARGNLDGSTYGGDKGIFAYSGNPSGNDWGTVTNRVSNTGVIASDGQAAGTARYNHMAASYGGDKSIFAYGNDGSSLINVSNLISNTGNVGADVSGVGTARGEGAGAGYGYS
mgnify:FL=1